MQQFHNTGLVAYFFSLCLLVFVLSARLQLFLPTPNSLASVGNHVAIPLPKLT